jgi:hypothetical protein
LFDRPAGDEPGQLPGDEPNGGGKSIARAVCSAHFEFVLVVRSAVLLTPQMLFFGALFFRASQRQYFEPYSLKIWLLNRGLTTIVQRRMVSWRIFRWCAAMAGQRHIM